MEIYLKKPYSTGKDIRKLAMSIRETKLKDITKEFSINVMEALIEVKLNLDKIKELDISEKQLSASLQKGLKTLTIKRKDDILLIKPKGKEENIQEIYKIKEKIKDIIIKNAKGTYPLADIAAAEILILFDVSITNDKCDVCGRHPGTIYRTDNGTFCRKHVEY